MENTEKFRESKLRRMAHRRGLLLSKSRTRNTDDEEYGKFHISQSNMVIMGCGHRQFEATLDQVEEFLNEYRVPGT